MPVLTMCISNLVIFLMLATSGCRIYKKYGYGRVTCYQSARVFTPAPVSLSYPVPCLDLIWQQ
jgi:predicted acetyltransferase